MDAIEQEKPAPPVIKHEQIITEFSWWMNRDGVRKFVIVRIHHDFSFETKEATPNMVILLEMYFNQPVEIPWDIFIHNYNSGALVRLIRNI